MSDDWDALMAEVRALAQRLEHERQAQAACLTHTRCTCGED
jgi:hypothetical protein